MNIITNNCLGGFIYRDILKTEYQNPFIWTEFFNADDFVNFIKDFDSLNFENMIIEKDSEGLSNNFITVIDDKYKLGNRHIFFSKNDLTPRTQQDNAFEQNVNLYYCRPWEYIKEKYFSRLKRMKNDEKIIFFYARRFDTVEQMNRLSETANKLKIKCFIFSDKKINENEFTKVFYFRKKVNLAWQIQLINEYGEEIKNIIGHENV